MEKIRIGVIGIGDISDVYLNNLKQYDAVEVTACASRGLGKAQKKAAQHGISKAYGGAGALAPKDVRLKGLSFLGLGAGRLPSWLPKM